MLKHLKIYGQVQGVGYRYSMERKASELGITGWVRNRSDGSVEAMVQGSADQIEKIIAWAKQGPSSAHVDRLDIVETKQAKNEFTSFDMLPTL